MDARHDRSESDGRFGLDDTGSRIATIAGKLVPQSVARRAIDVTVTTDSPEVAVGNPVQFTIEFRNRLPVPVTVETPSRRLWRWSVDGYVEARENPAPTSNTPGEFSFEGSERKRIRREWSGRIRRHDGTVERWHDVGPGEYELSASLAVPDGPSDATTVRLVERR